MNLDKVKQNTTWNDASGSINTNFEKIRQAILAFQADGGGLDEAELEEYLASHGYTKEEWVLAQNALLEERIENLEQEGGAVNVEGSEFVKVDEDGTISLEIDPQGGLGQTEQGLGIVDIPSHLLQDITIDVDTAMSDTSGNAVANKVIKKYVDGKAEQAYEQANEYTNEEIASLREEIANSNGAKAIELQQEWVDGQEHSIGMTWEEYIATPYVVFTFPSQDGANLRFERVALCDRTANFTDIYVETQIGSSETAIVAEVFKSGTDAVIKFIDDIKALPRFLPTTNNADSKFLNAEGKWVEVQTDVDHPVFEFVYDESTNKATAEMVAALAEAIEADKLILCSGRTYKFILEQDGMYGLVSDAYMDITDGKLKTSILAVTASTYDVQFMEQEVPTGTEITESTVAGWGFTKNKGTITCIKMNGETKGTSGVVDLGNVLTEHQKLKDINGQSIVGEGNITIQGGGATPRVEMTAESAVLQPNTFHVWPMMDSLDLTLGAEQSGVMNRYLFQFRNPKAGLTMLTLPDDITWSEDTELDENGLPVMEATAFYRIEIIEGLASLKKWKLAYIVFADAEVERVLMANGIGDGSGITKRNAASVTVIPQWFKGNKNVTSFNEIQYFTGVKEIVQAAFNDCANLEIDLTGKLASVEYLGNGAFSYTKVKGVVSFPYLKGLYGQWQDHGMFANTEIEDAADLGNLASFIDGYSMWYTGFFGNCQKLRRAVLPSTMTSVGAFTFYGCSALETIICKAATPPSLGSECFSATNLNFLIYVPDASVEAYKNATGWSAYASRIMAMSDYGLSIICPSVIRCSSMMMSALNASDNAVWSIVGGAEFATITEDGVLTILPNAANAEVTIRCADSNGNADEKTITATYNEPLMYLPFDEDFVDAMGNASLLNAVACSIDESKGVIGASMNRPNTAGGLSYQPSFNASFSAKSFSVDVWVYLPSNAPNTYLGIAGKRTNANYGASWSFGINGQRVNISLSSTGIGFTNDFYTDAIIPFDKWTRLTMVRDYERGQYRVYVDASLAATFGASYALHDGSDGLGVGNYHTDTSNDYFVGNLDEFRIYEGCIFD